MYMDIVNIKKNVKHFLYLFAQGLCLTNIEFSLDKQNQVLTFTDMTETIRIIFLTSQYLKKCDSL